MSKCGKAANANQLPTATNQHRCGTGQSKNKRSKTKYGSMKAFPLEIKWQCESCYSCFSENLYQ